VSHFLEPATIHTRLLHNVSFVCDEDEKITLGYTTYIGAYRRHINPLSLDIMSDGSFLGSLSRLPRLINHYCQKARFERKVTSHRIDRIYESFNSFPFGLQHREEMNQRLAEIDAIREG
jgi:hypothetical protein